MTEYGFPLKLKDGSRVHILINIVEHNSGDISIKSLVDSEMDGIKPLGSIVFKHQNSK